jgi:hypothetical protein
MHDILIALVFVGMVTYPAVITALPLKKTEDEKNGFEALTLALANAKQAFPTGKAGTTISAS